MIVTLPLDISVTHFGLISIFLEATGISALGAKLILVDTVLLPPVGLGYKTTMAIEYDDSIPEPAATMVDLGIKHCGFTNALHDYLNRCNVHPH